MTTDTFTLRFIESHPEDAASALETINHEDMCDYIQSLSAKYAALIIRHLTPISASSCLARIPLNKVFPVLKLLPVNTACLLIRRMPSDKQKDIINHPSLPRSIKRSIHYPAETVGAIMDTDAMVLPARYTAREARIHLKKHSGIIYNRIFVTDDNQVLKGFIELKEIMFANSKVSLTQLVRRPNIKISVRDRVETIVPMTTMQQSGIFPVVDHKNRLMGVLTNETLKKAQLEHDGAILDEESVTNDLLDIFDAFCDTFDDFLIDRNQLK